MSDEINSYATMALRLWAAERRPHGHECPCLICADGRAYMGLPALKPQTAAGRRAA